MAVRRAHFLIKYPRLRKAIPTSHQECIRLLQQHIFLWHSIFGDDLLGIWYADDFSHDDTYRSISLDLRVIVRQSLYISVAGYGETLSRGKNLSVSYVTERQYLEPWQLLNRNWPLSRNRTLIPLYKGEFLRNLELKTYKIKHPRQNYLIRAQEAYREVKEALQELIKEIEGNKNLSFITSYENHLIWKILMVLAYCNERPYESGDIYGFAQQALHYQLIPSDFATFVKTHLKNRTRNIYLPQIDPNIFRFNLYPLTEEEGMIIKHLTSNLVAEMGQIIEDEIRKLPSNSLKFQIPTLPL